MKKMTNCKEIGLPIGLFFKLKEAKYRCLGLGTIDEIDEKNFVIKSFGITDDESTELKNNVLKDHARYHTAEGLTNVPDVDWTKIPSEANPDEFESMIDNEKIRLTKSDMTISELISLIDQGKIAIPKFQRYYEWKPEQVTSLLNSIFHEYFIGNLLVWNAQNKKEKDMCGKMAVEGSHPENLRGDDIVIDGQQRITSLYYAIKGPEKNDKKNEKHPGYFYINLNNFITNGDEDECNYWFKEKNSRGGNFQ